MKDEEAGNVPFRQVVGSLMWIANQTRPDISHVVRAVARHSHEPKKNHWKAAQKILNYLLETPCNFEVQAGHNGSRRHVGRSWDNLKAGFQQPGYATLNWTLSDWNGAVTERVEMTEVQEMMGMLPSLLQAESEGQGQEGSAALQEGAAGAAELGVPPSSHRELYPAVVVREGDTAEGECHSSRWLKESVSSCRWRHW
ncbi:unnamed protein product [Ectocarpus sp. CCAP 1310/34]|nr:unnamed protein product [Ectocarpus sp. CCAP 1310/34]